MGLIEVYTVAVGLLLVAGLWSIVITIPKVTSRWRGAYWLALALNLSLLTAFTLGWLQQIGVFDAPRGWTTASLLSSLFLVALELHLVPYIHRLEHRLSKVEGGQPWNPQ